MWFFDQLAPGSSLYNVPFAVRLRYAVDASLLAETLRHLMLRHESWRTLFQVTADEPRQIILPELAVPLRAIDLRALSQAEREQAIQAAAQQEAQAPFNLEHGPLVRVAALRTAEEETLLIITQHHIITDGASLELLVEELLMTYAALRAGQTPPLPTLALDYADFAAWQRDWLAGANGQQQLAAWQERIANYPDVLDIPTDYPRPAVQTYNGALHSFGIDADLVARVHALSREYSVTPYMILLTAFEVVLQRYTQQDSFLIGTVVSGRTQAALEGLW